VSPLSSAPNNRPAVPWRAAPLPCPCTLSGAASLHPPNSPSPLSPVRSELRCPEPPRRIPRTRPVLSHHPAQAPVILYVTPRPSYGPLRYTPSPSLHSSSSFLSSHTHTQPPHCIPRTHEYIAVRRGRARRGLTVPGGAVTNGPGRSRKRPDVTVTP
jgi:hypothetical protein